MTKPEAGQRGGPSHRRAMRFILLFGVISLLADLTYEGARSITGPFLAVLGASGTAVGVVAGLGELVGYGLRVLSGYVADRTGRYWAFTIAGYAVNLLAVPLLALSGRWEVAAALMIAERLGKAIRTPARDAMLSHATGIVGHGWGFGIHEALDQIGAVGGPLIVAAVLLAEKGYRLGFAVLVVPALLALAVLLVARRQVPNPPQAFAGPEKHVGGEAPRALRYYLLGVAFVAAGFVDFPLIAYHFQRTALATEAWIPVFYATAMGVDALAALAFGRLFDRFGIRVLAGAVVLSAGFAPLVFLGGFETALVGMVLWGIGMGAQESIMRAAVARLVPAARRGWAYGLFSAGFGVAWFVGSTVLGVLYDASIPLLIAFSVGVQLLAVPVFIALARTRKG